MDYYYEQYFNTNEGKKNEYARFQFTIRCIVTRLLILHAEILNFGEKKLDYKIILLKRHY